MKSLGETLCFLVCLLSLFKPFLGEYTAPSSSDISLIAEPDAPTHPWRRDAFLAPDPVGISTIGAAPCQRARHFSYAAFCVVRHWWYAVSLASSHESAS